MGKVLKIIFRVIVVILLILVGSCIATTYLFGVKENSQATAIANQLLPQIVANWNVDALRTNLNPEGSFGIMDSNGTTLRSGSGVDPAFISQTFDALRTKFGAMKNFGEAKCTGVSSAAQCRAKVSYEHGDAQIILMLNDGRIMSFMVADWNTSGTKK